MFVVLSMLGYLSSRRAVLDRDVGQLALQGGHMEIAKFISEQMLSGLYMNRVRCSENSVRCSVFCSAWKLFGLVLNNLFSSSGKHMSCSNVSGVLFGVLHACCVRCSVCSNQKTCLLVE